MEERLDKMQYSELLALKKYSKENKKNIFKNFLQNKEEEIMRKNPHYMKFLSIEKQIRKKLEEGFTKKTLWNYLKEEKILECSYSIFCRYLTIGEEEEKKPTKEAKEETTNRK